MAKFCVYCGAELKEGADICLSCGKFVVDDNDKSAIKEEKKPATGRLCCVSGILLTLTIVFYITAILKAWVDSGNHYFWLGNDHYLAMILAAAFFVMSIVTFVIAITEYKAKKIGLNERYISIFLFTVGMIMPYVMMVDWFFQQ
ncbi:MAG TPA: zinc ribbon domain-containing protein [Bacillota bacterium]|nr:zinc ribbon domain-containing protein [Bacillota bacterium]HPF41974.1 zinc ribbon domain-containing protein [Bacillota bacterium]HPJ85952.1 zinc ribbon domain-containing protein [Bacillota bacterium]HPQ61846.1 zinc ribbon domain-containing protein [Bacillota bacterium]HRX91177.1 zinc ribbon domain-containing protein [Candidatus Izemoplasmatales bacterium]